MTRERERERERAGERKSPRRVGRRRSRKMICSRCKLKPVDLVPLLSKDCTELFLFSLCSPCIAKCAILSLSLESPVPDEPPSFLSSSSSAPLPGGKRTSLQGPAPSAPPLSLSLLPETTAGTLSSLLTSLPDPPERVFSRSLLSLVGERRWREYEIEDECRHLQYVVRQKRLQQKFMAGYGVHEFRDKREYQGEW